MDTQFDINAVKWTYRQYLETIKTPDAKAEVKAFGAKLYQMKVDDEQERNALLNEALKLNADIQHYQALIGKTEGMLERNQLEIQAAKATLTPTLRLSLFPEDAIAVGQTVQAEIQTQAQTKHQGKNQEQTLELALDLRLRRDKT